MVSWLSSGLSLLTNNIFIVISTRRKLTHKLSYVLRRYATLSKDSVGGGCPISKRPMQHMRRA